jgi:hypothetical protein
MPREVPASSRRSISTGYQRLRYLLTRTLAKSLVLGSRERHALAHRTICATAASIAVAVLAGCNSRSQALLWPGSRYRRATARGL